MDKKTVAQATGVLALRTAYGLTPVRVLDVTQLWRQDNWSQRGRRFTTSYASRPHSLSNEEVGYPVLSLYGAGTMNQTQHAEAVKWLQETTLTMPDLIDQEGRDIEGVLPDFIGLRIVNNRKLVGDYVKLQAARDAEWAAEQQVRNAAATARKAQAEQFTAELDELGVNNMISMVSDYTVAVDVTTLTALIALAKQVERKPDTCDICGSDKEPCDCDWHKSGKLRDLDLDEF